MAPVEQKSTSAPSLPPGSQLAWSLADWIDHVHKEPNPPAPWTIAWQPNHIGSDYAAVLQNGNQYALVIQGTHGVPDMLEDFTCQFWVGFDPVSGAKIAMGAQAALLNMLMKTSSQQSSTQGMSLGSYLQSISGRWSASNPLLVTGHSLGGTLTALASCWIAFQFLNGQQPLSSLPTSIQAISFAAFAAGNQTLANFLNGSANYVPCFNRNDAIPHAWATNTTLNPIFNIANLLNKLFEPPGPRPMPAGSVQTAIQNKVTQMQTNQISYVQTTGKNSYQFNHASKLEPTWDLEASFQHNQAYAKHFASTTSAKQADVA